MPNASTEQKLRLLALIRESYYALKNKQHAIVVQESQKQKNLDYLDEK